jgi:hypothetical protein
VTRCDPVASRAFLFTTPLLPRRPPLRRRHRHRRTEIAYIDSDCLRRCACLPRRSFRLFWLPISRQNMPVAASSAAHRRCSTVCLVGTIGRISMSTLP